MQVVEVLSLHGDRKLSGKYEENEGSNALIYAAADLWRQIPSNGHIGLQYSRCNALLHSRLYPPFSRTPACTINSRCESHAVLSKRETKLLAALEC